jgi:hypothetical protein
MALPIILTLIVYACVAFVVIRLVFETDDTTDFKTGVLGILGALLWPAVLVYVIIFSLFFDE